MTSDPRGSVWRRWDPHIHAPGTVLNDQFGGAGPTDDYVLRIEAASPALEAVGVTDYLITRCYEAILAAKAAGRLPKVELIFPNVEMRLSIETKKGRGLNLHLLVSPEDPDHLAELHRFLCRLTFDYKGDKYVCVEEELVRLGRAHDPNAVDDESALRVGVNQFKVDFRQLRAEFEASDWMRANCLVAVAGSSTDGTAGLQSESAAFAATRKEIERFAHLVFASGDSQIRFWRGEGTLSVDELDHEYGGPKPCLHGSDAHCLDDVGSPDLDRLTWLKGDAVYETLRQACLEPTTRVFIGALPPDLVNPQRGVSDVSTEGADWLLAGEVVVNPGLVAVIGSRGSGKTALADLIAHGGGNSSPIDTKDSFLRRASAHLSGVQVLLNWTNGDFVSRDLQTSPGVFESEIHYLSQQFVEKLCSAEGASDELVDEIQRVVFAAHEPATRMEATTFAELVEAKVGDARRQREQLRERLDRMSADVLTERLRKQALPAKRKELAGLNERKATDDKARAGIIKTGEKERAAYYERLRLAVEARERTIQATEKRTQEIEHLRDAVDRYRRSTFPDLVQRLRAQFPTLALTHAEWAVFEIQFSGDPGGLITSKLTTGATELAAQNAGDPAAQVSITASVTELEKAPLATLRTAFAKVGSEIGIDHQNAQRLRTLNARVAATDLEIEKLQREIELFEGAEERLTVVSQARADCYRDYFELVVLEGDTLQELYRPLEAQLAAGSPTVGRLQLVVVRHVDVDQWAARGESLIDLRKSGTFKGQGSLAEFARARLVPAWESGTAAEVAEAMTEFRAEYDAAILAQSRADASVDQAAYQQWTLDVGRWLYSTEHVDVRYSFEYDGLPLSQLSPGTRGLVLLLLYLALDLEDARPLIIDQPEENLDPRSVFTELVSLFRAARSRRQVVIVTHNANLVVNTDVDQVIVAQCERRGEGQPPVFSYNSGSLENEGIRREVCDILEGGEKAFLDRARRLRVRRL